ncbi:hypothetical protein GCM10023208_34730 [Erythrobacter westpacificensis]|uniref:DUF1640 domain-containing protein n=1 Tax=Erythrobacter westpacificensis TaxID=1055231 RepID=A0ABP9KQ54_9SPHN
MHVKLYQSLKSVNVSDDAAAEVVDAVEEYLAVKIKEATAGMEAKLNALTWLVGSIGVLLSAAAIIGTAAAFFK